VRYAEWEIIGEPGYRRSIGVTSNPADKTAKHNATTLLSLVIHANAHADRAHARKAAVACATSLSVNRLRSSVVTLEAEASLSACC